MAEKDFEADDLELKDYAFEPETYTVNDVQITDYTGIEHDKIFLVNKKDILTKPRPSWIPELDENCLEREDFLPHCVKDSDGYYFVQKTSLDVPEDYNGPKLSDYEKRQKFTKKTYYKMSLDLIAATCDYYIKKRRAEIKLSGDTHRVGFPRSAGSMTWARYDDMVSMFSLCEAYKDDPEITKNYGHIKARRNNPKHKGYIRQTEIAFHDHYGPLLQELKDKKLDMNLQKQDAADTHKKGEETSYGMSGRSDTLKKNFGVTIKKQNGTGFDSQQLKNISEALENVWNHYGKLDDVAIAFNLGISYAANTLQHARKAVGIFHPEYHAIGVSFFEEKVADSKDSSMVLCHEVAHWLDFEKGNRDHFHYASDKSGTLENKIALKFKELVRKRNSGGKKLGDYWYRTCECLARAMEEDYGLKHNCYDFYNDQAYLTPEVFKKEIAPLVEQLLEENRKYFNLVKKENLSKELSTAKDLSFFDVNENALRKLIKSYTSSAASLAETEKSKPDTFNYLRGANKAMDNKINRYQEKIVKLQTKVDVLNMLVQLETKQAFGQFEMKTLETDICPVDRDDILRMDKNSFEYYAAVINSALKNAGFSEKKSIPLVLKNPSGYTFNTLNILEDGNIEVVSGSVNSLSEDEFKAIKEKNLELQKKIFDEVKIQLEKNRENNIENSFSSALPDKKTDVNTRDEKNLLADFTDSVIEEICFGMWEAEDKILLKEHEEQFPDIKYPAYPGTEWVLKVIEKHRDEYKDADFTVLSDTLVKEIEAEKINNQKKIEFLKKELDNKEYPLSETEASDINENIRRFESLTDEDFKNLVLWKQRMLKESEARRNAVFEDMLEKEKRKSTVQEGEMYSYNDLHPSVTVINRKTNRQAEIRPTGTSAKNLMQLCGLKSLSEADNLIKKIQTAGFSILSTDARIILYNDEKYYDFRENHASYNFATREFEYDEDKRNLKIWDFRDYIKKGLKITKKMKEFEKIENLGETKMEHKYTFFVKDTAEFEQFADFEPVTNLTAVQAVKKYAELRKDGYSCGIGMHIPGDFIFDDPDGNGITLVVNHEGTAVFDIYGDTFIDQLQEKDIENGRARLYIDLYKELYNAFESEGVSVKKPQFVFDKESELFTENKNLSHKGISFYEWAKKDPEDSRSLEYIICNKDSKTYFDDSQTISNNLMNFLRNSEFVNADYSDDKITVTLNFDDESFEMCQNELVKLDIDWGLEHRIHQVITYSRDTLDDDKQAFASLEEAKAAAKDYLSNDYYKDENNKPYYDGVCVLNNKTKEIEFTQGLFPSKEIFSLDVLDKNNFELTPNEISNKIENIYGYFFEYESNENTVDIYQYEKNENGSINKDGPQNFIGSLDSEGNFGFTDDYTEKLPDAVGQAAAMYFREITKSVSAEIELDPDDSYYELFRDNVTGKLITEELNQMGFVKDPDDNYVLDDIKVSLSLVFNNKENPALIISHISDPAVMQTIHLNDSYAKKHSLGMSFKDLLESGWLKDTKNPNLKSFIDGNMLERDFIGKYIPDADNNKAVTLLDDITAYEDGFSDVLKSFKDFKDAWDIPVSSEKEVSEFGGKLQKALYNAAEAIKDKKAYADSLLRYAEKYKPGMEDPDNVYGKFQFHEDELKVFLKVNMINASIYNMATDINKNGTQIVFALMSSKDKRHYGYITADFDDPANCKYNFTDLKDHNLDISLTENISKMRDFCEKGKPFYGASENHSVNIELTSDGSKLSLTFNEVPDIDLRSSLNWAGFKYSTIAKAWKADFNQENSDKLLATVKKYWPDDYEHAAKQMEGIGTKTAAEHKKESVSVDFSQIENTSEKLAENIKFINKKYPEYKGNLTHILTDIMFNATSKNRNEILDKFRDCNNKDELNSKLKKMVYGSFETEIKKQQNVKPKKDPEEGFSR